MPEDQRIASVLLKYDVDIRALKASEFAVAKTKSDIQFMATLAKQQELATAKVGASIRDAFSSQASSRIASFQSEIKTATTSTQGLTAALNEAAVAEAALSTGGGLSGGLQKLGGLGRELKALPAIPLGNSGLSTDAVGKMLQVLGKLPPAALAAGGALGVVAVALKVASDAATAQGEAVKASNELQAEVTRAVLTNTREQLQAKIDEQNAERAIQVAILQERLAGIADIAAGEKNLRQIVGDQYVEGAIALGLYAGDLKQQRQDVIDTSKAITDIDTKTKAYKDALGEGRTAAADAAEAEKELADARLKTTNRSIKYVLDQSKFEQDAAKLSTTQNQQKQDDIQNQIALVTQEIQLRQKSGDASKENGDKLDELALQYAGLSQQAAFLTNKGLELAKANDAVAESEKNRAATIAAFGKFQEDKLKINSDFEAKQVDLATKLADKQVEIAAKAVEDAEALLEKLEQKLADLATNAQRDIDKDVRKANFDSLQEQIKFQRDEVAETKKHFEDVARIRRQAQDSEFEQGLDRDFAGLARSRRATAQQINESNIAFNEDRAARLTAFNAKRSDDSAQFAFEQKERLIKFAQDIADARAQAVREQKLANDNRVKQLAAALAANQKEVALLDSKHRAELSLLNAAIKTDLDMIAAGNAAKLALDAQYIAQAIAIRQGALSGGSTSSISGLSSGVSGISSISSGLSAGVVSGRNVTNSTTTNGGFQLNMPVTIQTGGSAAQVQAIVPALRKEFDAALTAYHRSVYGTPR